MSARKLPVQFNRMLTPKSSQSHFLALCCITRTFSERVTCLEFINSVSCKVSASDKDAVHGYELKIPLRFEEKYKDLKLTYLLFLSPHEALRIFLQVFIKYIISILR